MDAWVPTVGTLRAIAFTGARGHANEESFRYNLATGSAIVADMIAVGLLESVHRHHSIFG